MAKCGSSVEEVVKTISVHGLLISETVAGVFRGVIVDLGPYLNAAEMPTE
jgi:hypothetical protein